MRLLFAAIVLLPLLAAAETAYVTDNLRLGKPAKLIVAETEAQRARLEAELGELRRQFEGPAETIAALQVQVNELQQRLDESEARARELAGQNDELRGRQQQYKYSLPLTWVGGAIGAALIGGLLLGFWWVDHRSRKRHGGIRIY